MRRSWGEEAPLPNSSISTSRCFLLTAGPNAQEVTGTVNTECHWAGCLFTSARITRFQLLVQQPVMKPGKVGKQGHA